MWMPAIGHELGRSNSRTPGRIVRTSHRLDVAHPVIDPRTDIITTDNPSGAFSSANSDDNRPVDSAAD